MHWLRILLVTTSIGSAGFMLFIVVQEGHRFRSYETWMTLFILTGLALNLLYLVLHDRPPARREVRLFRLFRLWLDAKETELRRRSEP